MTLDGHWMRFASFLVLAILSSACLGDDGIRVEATTPLLMDSYAYDGRGIRRATGSIDVRLDAEANTGTVTAQARDLFHLYEVEWRSFGGKEPFKSGGIATRIDLWGSTGNGSADLPKMRVHVAAFGLVVSRIDGTPEKDPSNLEDLMPAVLAVTQGRHRDPETLRITTSEKLAPYDPSNPDDAYVNQIGAQAVLLLFTARGELWRHFDYQDVTLRAR